MWTSNDINSRKFGINEVNYFFGYKHIQVDCRLIRGLMTPGPKNGECMHEWLISLVKLSSWMTLNLHKGAQLHLEATFSTPCKLGRQ